MAFETNLNFAIGAIIELAPQMDQNPPQLPPNGLSNVVTTYCGNGCWHNRSSYYFNCGVTMVANTPGRVGEKGHLGLSDGYNVETYFLSEFDRYRANVLKDRDKWNFTFVKNGRAFNYHLLVG